MTVDLTQKELQQIILSLGNQKYKDVYQLVLKLTIAMQQTTPETKTKPLPPVKMANVEKK